MTSPHNGGTAQEGEATQSARRNSVKKTQATEDGSKKTQAQRLLEFEMWQDTAAIKGLEYSQRRSEKQQRRKESRERSGRRWKKLYLPSILTMLAGSLLTLGAVVRSMSSLLWEARETLVIVGPVLLALGLLGLMTAAACTFSHDQRDQERPGPSEWLLGGWGDQFQDQVHPETPRPAPPLRSLSQDTADLPVPEDLDPNKNYLLPGAGWAAGGGGAGRGGSVSGAALLDSGRSYSSTASWVQSVAESHGPPPGRLTRQNSDGNLLTWSGGPHPAARRFLDDHATTDLLGEAGSLFHRHVACTRSWTSSGYQSSGGSTVSAVEYQVSGEQAAGLMVTFSRPSVHLPGPCPPPRGAGPQMSVKDGCTPPHRPGVRRVQSASRAKAVLLAVPSGRRHSTTAAFRGPLIPAAGSESAAGRRPRLGEKCRSQSEVSCGAEQGSSRLRCAPKGRSVLVCGVHGGRCVQHVGDRSSGPPVSPVSVGPPVSPVSVGPPVSPVSVGPPVSPVSVGPPVSLGPPDPYTQLSVKCTDV